MAEYGIVVEVMVAKCDVVVEADCIIVKLGVVLS